MNIKMCLKYKFNAIVMFNWRYWYLSKLSGSLSDCLSDWLVAMVHDRFFNMVEKIDEVNAIQIQQQMIYLMRFIILVVLNIFVY